MTPPPIVRADLEGLVWLLIIIGSIVAQVVKASKKARSSSRPGDAPSPPSPDRRPLFGESEPETELREFLRRLGQPAETPPPAPPPAETPPAPPPPPRRRTTPPPVHARSSRPLPRPAPRPALRVPPRRQAPRPPPRPASPVAAPVRPATTMDAYALGPARREGATLRRQLRRTLSDRESIRAAVLAREILGPPLGLRGLNPPATRS